MHDQLIVWAFFALLLIPVGGIAVCWASWRRRAYADQRRKRVAQTGLAVGSFAVLFAAALPIVATLPLHMHGGLGEAGAGVGVSAGVAACPLAVVLLAFGFGLERWLGVASVALALAADLAMLVGAAS